MKVLVVGSGGREHALAWKLAQSEHCDELHAAPGNPGIAKIGDCHPVRAEDGEGLLGFCGEHDIDLVVVGPEAPLVAGVADQLRHAGVAVFGPSAAAARIEGSKSFAKDVMVAAGVPTAERLAVARPPCVVKVDGLAAGKGVFVCRTQEELDAGLQAAGGGGDSLVIEELLEGPEVSLFAVCDGTRAVPLGAAQDFKRAADGDLGPNTGGMGAYSPAPVVTPKIHARVMREIIQPAIQGMAQDGVPYSGFLYAGLMIDRSGNPKALEFNCRLGDPETQPILLRLKSDLLELVERALAGTLSRVEAAWDRRAALGVVLAAHGYPDEPRKGDRIGGLPAPAEDCRVFHAGTRLEGKELVTSGGRVLCVTALGDSVRMARTRAYEAVDRIRFDGMQYRRDIGFRAIAPRRS